MRVGRSKRCFERLCQLRFIRYSSQAQALVKNNTEIVAAIALNNNKAPRP
jgi:hypothetical protein